MENSDVKIADGAFPMMIGGIELKASMLTDRDYADLQLYIQSRYIAMASNSLSMVKDMATRKEVLKVAMDAALNIGWGTQEGQDIIWSDDGEGILHLGFQMIRKRHPAMTYENFVKQAGSNEDKVNSLNNIAMAWQALHLRSLPQDANELGASGGSSTVNIKR